MMFEALTKAGWKVSRFIEESVSAAFYYHEKINLGEVAIIFDIGSTTLDITKILFDNQFEII